MARYPHVTLVVQGFEDVAAAFLRASIEIRKLVPMFRRNQRRARAAAIRAQNQARKA